MFPDSKDKGRKYELGGNWLDEICPKTTKEAQAMAE